LDISTFTPTIEEPEVAEELDISTFASPEEPVVTPQAEAPELDISTFKPSEPATPPAIQQFPAQLGFDQADPNKLSRVGRPPRVEPEAPSADETRALETQVAPLQLETRGGSAFGAVTQPFAKLGTKFFVKPIRGLIQSAVAPHRKINEFAKQVGIDNKVTSAISKIWRKA